MKFNLLDLRNLCTISKEGLVKVLGNNSKYICIQIDGSRRQQFCECWMLTVCWQDAQGKSLQRVSLASSCCSGAELLSNSDPAMPVSLEQWQMSVALVRMLKALVESVE